jgi:hypothetical protein
MVDRCFRHQHPEAYGRPEVGDPLIPTQLRYGSEEFIPESPPVPEEPMGDPQAVPLA